MNSCKQCRKPLSRYRDGGRYILTTVWDGSSTRTPRQKGGAPIYLCSWACLAKLASLRNMKEQADRMARQDEDREPEPSEQEREAEARGDSGEYGQ